MKQIVVLIFIFSSIVGRSQVAYYDAKAIAATNPEILNGKVTIQDNDDLYKILRNYTSKNDSTKKLIGQAFSNNPFIEVEIPAGGNKINPSTILSSIGGLDITNIADGLAKFLIKRGKEELNIAFFQKLKDFLEDSDYPEAKTLFPESVIVLGKIASYRYAELLPTLREAFYKDVNNLIVNLNRLIDLPKYETLLKTLPEIRVAVRSSKIISDLTKPDSSIHPANLISRFAELREWGEMNDNLHNSWQVLNKISNSVRKAPYTIRTSSDTVYTTVVKEVFRIKPGDKWVDTIKLENGYYKLHADSLVDSDPLVKFELIKSPTITTKPDTVWNNEVAWIKFSDFEKDILRDTITLKIYLGLLYERMHGLHFRYAANKDTTVQDFMRDNASNIFKIASLTNDFLTLANDVELAIKEIKEKKVNGLTDEDYYTYIEKVINVAEYGFKVANSVKEGVADDRYITMARNGNNLYKNIYTKNYNAAIFNGYSILKEILVKYKSAVNEKAKYYDSLKVATTKLSRCIRPNERDAFLNDTTSFKADSAKLTREKYFEQKSRQEKLVENILRYGNAMASIVKAENSEEAAAAIEAAALPAGSSSIKKNSQWNISINSYIGGYFGTKYSGENLIDGNNSTVGVYAPVGVAFSKGLGHYWNGNPIGAITIYGTLFDVGAIAGYRLNDDNTALEQKVTINDIFSPGGYLVYGFGFPIKGFSYIPISIGYGWQYGSKLYYRKTDGMLEISDKSRWRSNWFVGIDIPLVNLWTRNYKNSGK